MNNNKSIKILNELIALHHTRVKGYEVAVKGTADEDLKVLFNHLIRTSVQSNEELAREVRKLGGIPAEGEREGGKFFNAWAEVKDALTEEDSNEILEACDNCEKIILNAYERAIDNDDDLSEAQTSLVNAQHTWLKANQDELIEANGSLTPHQ